MHSEFYVSITGEVNDHKQRSKSPPEICREFYHAVLLHTRYPCTGFQSIIKPFFCLIAFLFWSFIAFVLIGLTTTVTSFLPKMNATISTWFLVWPAILLNYVAHTGKHVSRWLIYLTGFSSSPLSVLWVWATQCCFQSTGFSFSVFLLKSFVHIPSINTYYHVKNDLGVQVGKMRSWCCHFSIS